MKNIIISVFESRDATEKAINKLHKEHDIPNEEISFIYRNTEGETKEVSAEEISSDTPAEGAGKGATIGGTIGALAGLAIIAGVIPALGPIVAAGPLAAALGLTGAVGTTVAGAATGAVAGGLIGALVNLGVGKEHAQNYEDKVQAGNILLVVHAENDRKVMDVLDECGAVEVQSFKPVV